VDKIAKKQSEGVHLYCQKYTHTDCFFGDFSHWGSTESLSSWYTCCH